jgi:hypothetical protein
MSRMGSESALHRRRGSTDARGAGGLAWARARHLAETRLRRSRSAVRLCRLRRALAGLLGIVIAWSTAAISWQARTQSPVFAGLVLLAGVTMSTLAARRVLTQSRRLRRANSAMRWIRYVSRSPWTDVEAGLLPAATGQSDIEYWALSAFTHRSTAHALEQLNSEQTWWHDLQLQSDPSLILDHVSVGKNGIIVVHDIVMSTRDALSVDALFGLSYRGWQLGTPGTEQVLALQMRTASTIARAAGLDLPQVTSIAVIANASLMDAWGARTEFEHLRHLEGGVAVIYCTPAQLPAALLTETHLDAEAAVLAAHEIDESISTTLPDVVHKPTRRTPFRDRDQRRFDIPEQKEHHG